MSNRGSSPAGRAKQVAVGGTRYSVRGWVRGEAHSRYSQWAESGPEGAREVTGRYGGAPVSVGAAAASLLRETAPKRVPALRAALTAALESLGRYEDKCAEAELPLEGGGLVLPELTAAELRGELEEVEELACSGDRLAELGEAVGRSASALGAADESLAPLPRDRCGAAGGSLAAADAVEPEEILRVEAMAVPQGRVVEKLTEAVVARLGALTAATAAAAGSTAGD